MQPGTQVILTAVCTALFALLYFIFTGRIVRRKPGLLWFPAVVLAALSTGYYWYVYGLTGVVDVLPRLTMSVRDALNMFLFNMNSTYGHFTEYFYLDLDADGAVVDNIAVRCHLMTLVCLYVCSVWTTSILVIHFFARRLTSRMVLAWKTRMQPGKAVMLFLGTEEKAFSVAKSLGKGKNVVMIDFPEQEILPGKISFFQMFKGVRSSSRTGESIHRDIPDALVLKARRPLSQCSAQRFFKDMGLPGLARWTANPNTTVFLLGERQEDNLAALRKLGGVAAGIYCHAKREGLALRLEMAADNVHIVDGSYLATKALKMREDLYPIHYVDIGRTKDGEAAGYVDSAFNALICGFGQAGRGTLSFLYEFGAFAGADKQPSAFHCEVIDRNIDTVSGAFWYQHPGVSRERVHFLQKEVGSTAFWEHLATAIARLNFIFVGMSNDSENLRTALDILEFAYKHRPEKKNFVILVKLNHPETYRSTLDFYNRSYGAEGCIRTMGEAATVWNWNNLSGENYLEKAKEFFMAYNQTTGTQMDWESRNRIILGKKASALANKQEIARKTEQDFANSFHTSVKGILCPGSCWDLSDAIPLQMEDGKHSIGTTSAQEKLLEYLAVGEHIRWSAFLEINGYQYAPETREDLKTHKDLVPYEQLDQSTRHYDWVMVKTTLDILRKKK